MDQTPAHFVPREVGPRPQYPIESVDNALKLLLLYGDRGQVSLTAASQYLGVATSTAHRLLAALQYRGFVVQDRVTKAYRPGPTLTSIALSILQRDDVRERMRPVLQRLNEVTDETVHLGVLEGNTVRFLDAIESRRAVRVTSRAGRSMPAHCTSTGKALLAELSEQELRQLFPEQELVQVTGASIATRTKLLEELTEVRRVGYAVNREESEEGVSSLSMAVPRNAAEPALALNVALPTSRLTPVRFQEIVVALRTVVHGERKD